jgi:hypothetical protein
VPETNDALAHRERLEGVLRDTNADARIAALSRPPKPSPVAPGLYITGMPGIAELARYEEISRRRFSPRRLRWKDVAELDQRASEIEARVTTTAAELNDARAQLANADNADADAVSRWYDLGANGKRPEPSKPALEQRVHDLEIEHEALQRAHAGAPGQGRVRHQAPQAPSQARTCARRAGAVRHAEPRRQAAARPRHARRRP